jgi:hypothetical protein
VRRAVLEGGRAEDHGVDLLAQQGRGQLVELRERPGLRPDAAQVGGGR